jgi:tetratricopeptide (TPR) repeat protein
MLEQAVGLAPDFALAYVNLCEAHLSIYFYGYEHTAERLSKAKEAIDRAISLQPELPEVHRQLGYYYYQGKLDYDSALREFSLAAEHLPDDPRLIQDMAYIWRRQGHFKQAAANLEQASLIDPRNSITSIPSSYSIASFSISPTLAPLREQPGYRRLIRVYTK